MKNSLHFWKVSIALVCLLLPLSGSGLFAVDKAWIGTVSNDWNHPDNWSPVGVPLAADDVNFFLNAVTDTIVVPSGFVAVAKSFEVYLYSGSHLNFHVVSGGILSLNGVGTRAHGFTVRVYSGSTADIQIDGELKVENFESRNIYLYNQSNDAINFTNTGLVEVKDCGSYGMHIDVAGGASLGAYNLFDNQGTVEVSDGTQYAIYLSGRSNRPSNFLNQGTLSCLNTNYIVWVNTEGSLTQTVTGTLIGEGIIRKIGNLSLDGALEFGDAPSVISMETGTSEFDLSELVLRPKVEGTAGNGASGGNDYLAVVGNANLGGFEVEVSFEGGFLPSSGDSFDLITVSGTITGSPIFHFPPPPPGLAFSLINGSGVFSMEVVPAGLPVELLTFHASQLGNAVKLGWETASEIQNEGFFVQRSIDALLWESLDFVAGQGNSNTTQTYGYEDRVPGDGRYLYRLQQRDIDGKVSYSPTVEVLVTHALELGLKLYPVPATTTLTVEGVPGSCMLLGALGQVIEVRKVGYEPSTFDVSVLPPGMYYLRIQTEDQGLVQGRWLKQ